MNKFLLKLIERYPALAENQGSINQAYDIIVSSLSLSGTLFVCGNGGSAADGEHIVGELLKGFVKKRPLPPELKQRFAEEFGEDGAETAAKLQGGLKAIALSSHPAFASAFLNDVDGTLIYAQQLHVLGGKNDVLLSISCSGNAENARKAMMVAKIKGIKNILLTGNRNGTCTKYADCIINVPCADTFMIQEYHLPIYHTLCLMIEDHFYEE